METAIKWFYDRLGRTFYSMTQRNGQVVNGKYGFDCSSSVYYAIIAGGLIPPMRIGNTDSMYGDLERNGWTRILPNSQGNFDTQRGDIFLWGKRGASGGGAGHTGMFINANDIIHCAAFSNGITTNNYDQLRGWNGYPEQTFYRYTGGTTTPVDSNPVDQDLAIGSTIKFDKAFIVDDIQLLGGLWQVRTNELARDDFSWDDNGIPAEPLVEVDNDGYATSDQDLNTGSKYKIPGKYTVLDLGEYKGRWLAMIEWNGLKFWVDTEPATEIKASDSGTAAPSYRPTPPKEDTKPVEPPKEEPKPTEPVKEEPTKPVEPEKPVEETKPPKETPVAFTQENQKELAVQQASVLNANTDFTPVISDQAKTIAYFATDIGSIVSTLVFTALGLLHIVDAINALALNAAIVVALLGVKQTFRLSAKKQ